MAKHNEIDNRQDVSTSLNAIGVKTSRPASQKNIARIKEFFNRKNIYNQLKTMVSFLIPNRQDVDLKLNIGGGSYTNGESITVGLPEIFMESSLEEIYTALSALLGHESQHVNSSDFKAFVQFQKDIGDYFYKKYNIPQSYGMKIGKHLFNSVEDGRIEKILCNKLPGYKPEIQFLNGSFWEAQPIKGDSELGDFLSTITSYSVTGLYPKGFKDIYKGSALHKTMQSIEDDIHSGIDAITCKQCVMVCHDIILKSEDYLAELLKNRSQEDENFMQNMPQENEWTTSEENESNNSDSVSTHFVPKKKKKEEKKEDDKKEEQKPQEEKQNSGEGSDNDNDEKDDKEDGAGEGESSNQDKSDENPDEEGNSGESDEDDNSDEEGSSDGSGNSDKNDDESGEEGNSGKSDESDENDESGEEGNSGKSDKSDEDDQSDEEGNPDGSGKSDENEDESGEEGNSDDSNGSDKDDNESDKDGNSGKSDESDDNNSDKNDNKSDEEGKEGKSNKDENEDEQDSDENFDSEKNLPEGVNQLDNDGAEVDEEEIREKMKEITDEVIKESEKKIKEADSKKSNSNSTKNKKEDNLELTPEELQEIEDHYREQYTKKFVELKGFPNRYSLPDDIKREGSKFRKEVEKIFKNKETYNLRAQKKGLVDTGNLWKVGMGDHNVFMKKGKPITTDFVAFILQDGSGSMKSHGKEYESSKAMSVMEIGLKGIIPLKQSTFSVGGGAVVHYTAKDWKDNESSKNYSYNFHRSRQASGGNKDGYSIRIATAELMKRPEKDRILIILSDGLPSDYNKGQKEGMLDVKEAVKEARKKGIHVVSILFGTEDFREESYEMYKMMYDRNIISSAPDKITTNLVKMLKKIISR